MQPLYLFLFLKVRTSILFCFLRYIPGNQILDALREFIKADIVKGILQNISKVLICIYHYSMHITFKFIRKHYWI